MPGAVIAGELDDGVSLITGVLGEVSLITKSSLLAAKFSLCSVELDVSLAGGLDDLMGNLSDFLMFFAGSEFGDRLS